MILPLIRVEFCAANVHAGSRPAFERLKQEPGLDVREYGCLSQCELCAETLYCYVKDEIVTGGTPEELVANVLAKVAALNV